jgi:nucleotide-binding universal stress UspA family protein
VLVVPRSQVPTGKRRGPIVVGLAADASDRTVLEETRRWAEQLQATVAVVHAIILPGFASRNLPDGRGGYSNIMAEERKRLAESLPELGRTTKVHVELGSAAHLLQLHARQANARMIVVGKRAKRARWGTVLGDLTQSADRPLLVVPFTVTKSTPREEHA